MQRIFFLDIDGVLNVTRTFLTDPIFDRSAVDLICDLCQKHKLKLVISSVWRLGETKQSFAARLRRFGKDDRIMAYLHQDWKTPVHRTRHRGTEVALWLAHHPSPISYVCVDDDSDFHEDQPLIQTHADVGFSIAEYFMVDLYFQQAVCGYSSELQWQVNQLSAMYTWQKTLADRQLQRIRRYFP